MVAACLTYFLIIILNEFIVRIWSFDIVATYIIVNLPEDDQSQDYLVETVLTRSSSYPWCITNTWFHLLDTVLRKRSKCWCTNMSTKGIFETAETLKGETTTYYTGIIKCSCPLERMFIDPSYPECAYQH